MDPRTGPLADVEPADTHAGVWKCLQPESGPGIRGKDVLLTLLWENIWDGEFSRLHLFLETKFYNAEKGAMY